MSTHPVVFSEVEATRAIRAEIRSHRDLSTVDVKSVARKVRKALEETHDTCFKAMKKQFRTLTRLLYEQIQTHQQLRAEKRKAEVMAHHLCDTKGDRADLTLSPGSMSVTPSSPLAVATQPPLAARFTTHLATVTNPSIRLLREPTVIQWLTGDVRFLDAIVAVAAVPVTTPIPRKTKKMIQDELKKTEDTWGRTTLRTRRPDLKLDQQWTNKFGEHICEELYTLLGARVTKPRNQNHYQPDGEIETAILEAKAQTFYTDGTAGEKILGVPFKYAEVPRLYGKPLRIICMGGAERVCRESYGNLSGSRTSAEKQKFLDFFKEMGVTFVAATTLLEMIISVAVPAVVAAVPVVAVPAVE